MLDLDEPISMPDMSLNDPSNFDCALFKGSGLDGVTVDSLPPSIIEDKSYAIEEGYLSDYCRFIILWMFMPLMSGGVHELDVDFGLKFGPFDGDGPRMSGPITLGDSRVHEGSQSRDLEVDSSYAPI